MQFDLLWKPRTSFAFPLRELSRDSSGRHAWQSCLWMTRHLRAHNSPVVRSVVDKSLGARPIQRLQAWY